LTRPFVEALHRRSRSVLGVFDGDEPAGRDHLLALGADATIASEVPVADVVAVIGALVPAARRAREQRAIVPSNGARGVTVVGGPAGVGTSEIALGLAAAIAARGESVVLIDADEHGSSLAVRLGLAIEPNLRNAVDAVAYGVGDLASTLVTVGGPRFRVLAGVPSRAAAQVRPHDVVDLVAAIVEQHQQVVVEVAPGVHTEIAGALLADATCVVGVAGANPVGVTRLVGWLSSLPAGLTAPHVVLNRASTERYRRAELTTEVCRACAPASLSFVPHDRRVERAVWDGQLVARGPFTSSVAALAQIAVPRGTRSGRDGRQSRARGQAA
jgi:MinD-like ATPase involved in chromosome partitioning or flagellar assembly